MQNTKDSNPAEQHFKLRIVSHVFLISALTLSVINGYRSMIQMRTGQDVIRMHQNRTMFYLLNNKMVHYYGDQALADQRLLTDKPFLDAARISELRTKIYDYSLSPEEYQRLSALERHEYWYGGYRAIIIALDPQDPSEFWAMRAPAGERADILWISSNALKAVGRIIHE